MSTPPPPLSPSLLSALRRFEGLRLVAYKPSGERSTGGQLTIGYGHLGALPGQRITAERAEELLRADVAHVARQIDSLRLQLRPSQRDALISFAFNVGFSALSRSTLLRKIRQRASLEQVQAELRRWVYSGGRRLEGLVARREWEAQQWAL